MIYGSQSPPGSAGAPARELNPETAHWTPHRELTEIMQQRSPVRFDAKVESSKNPMDLLTLALRSPRSRQGRPLWALLAAVFTAACGSVQLGPEDEGTDAPGYGGMAGAGTGGGTLPSTGGSASTTGGAGGLGGQGGEAPAFPESCAGSIAGSVVIEDMSDLAAIRGVCAVDGDLTIYKAKLSAIDLRLLERVGGTFNIENNEQLVSLRLSALREVSGLEVSDNPLLADLELPTLARAERVEIANNWVLETVSGPALATVGMFDLWDNGEFRVGLAKLDLSSLEVATRLSLSQPMTSPLRLPNLERVEALHSSWPIPGFDLPVLVEAGDITASNVSTFSAPALEVASVRLSLNGEISHVDLPKLREVDTLLIDGKRSLDALYLPALELCTSCSFRSAAMTKLELPVLRAADLLGVDAKILIALELPALQELRALEIIASKLERFGLPLLEPAAGAGSVILVGKPALVLEPNILAWLQSFETLGQLRLRAAVTELVFPELTSILGKMTFSGNPELTELVFPALMSVEGGVTFDDNPKLVRLGLPALGVVRDRMGLVRNPLLAELDLSSLTAVWYDLRIVGTGLTVLNLPQLGASEVWITGNLQLEVLNAPLLEYSWWTDYNIDEEKMDYEVFQVLEDNPLLVSCTWLRSTSCD